MDRAAASNDRLDALIASAPDVPLPPTPEFLTAAADLGLEFEPGEVEALGRYLGLLLHVNEAVNLTAIRDPSEAWMRHILDSLTLMPLLQETEPATIPALPTAAPLRVIDVGSGGGLPGIPLAIVMPGAHFTLLEATGKKAEFLRRAAARLGLTNVTVLAERAEIAAHQRAPARQGTSMLEPSVSGHRESYDAVIARAVGRVAMVAEVTAAFARVGGRVLLIKGEKADEELAEARGALDLLNLDHAGTIATPTGRIVVLDKTEATPRAYPRRSGEPKRSPLGVMPGRKRRPTGGVDEAAGP